MVWQKHQIQNPYPQQISEPAKKSFWRNLSHKIKPRILVVTLSIIILICLAWIIASFFGSIFKVFTKNYTGGSPFLAFLDEIQPNQLRGEGDGRINILLLGVGGAGHEGEYLTDTIMVASLDPKNKELALLSIPRDLYVTVPGYGKSKINAVYTNGEDLKKVANWSQKVQSKVEPIDGATLIKKTISNLLDLPIHYYVMVDFEGFKQVIDSLGGIEVEVEKDLYDPYYPTDTFGYQVFKISAGRHLMDGELALKYARSRETTSDFDRAKRQQQILSATKDKALSLKVLTNPAKVNQMIKILQDHVRTDFALWEIERLISIGKNIQNENIINKVLDDSPTGPLYASNVGGAFVLLPKKADYSEIQKIAHEIFIDPYLREENTRILIRNSSGTIGLAKDLANTLKSYGYNIVGVESGTLTEITKIIDYSNGKKPFTTRFLTQRISARVICPLPENGPANFDLLVIIGQNYPGFKIEQD